MIWQEAVRGRTIDPAVFSLPGVEVIRAAQRGRLPRSPMSHLLGLTVSSVSPGAVSYRMPVTPG